MRSLPLLDLAALGLVPPASRPKIPGGPPSVARVLDRALAEGPDREALVGRDARFTYAELDRAANRAAHALATLGVRAGDRVAASLPNSAEIVVAFLSTMRLGAIWVGINRPLAPPEKAYMLRDGEVAIFLGDPDMAAQVDAQRKELPDGGGGRGGGGGGGGAGGGAPAAGGQPRAAAAPFAPAAIAYTGGTTGFPKGAVHTQHNLLLPGAVARLTGSFGPDERQGVLLPLTILNLVVLVPLLAFQVGSACICMDRIDPPGVAAWVRDERIATFHAVPAILHDLLTHPDVSATDLATLRRPEVGGADCPDAFRALYRERFGQDVSIGYGMTEAPTAVTRALPGAPALPGLCGAPLPQVRIEIRGENGSLLPPGEVGEVCVAPATEGPAAGLYTPMLGYWKKPGETREALRDGVLHTGDLGTLDASGWLFLRGRKKELILRGGANVYPAEIERVLHGDPRVAACAVVGRPDERLGERVVAFVQAVPGTSPSAAELVTRCRAELARYKVPEEFVFVDTMPRTPMGKIRKPELRARLEGGSPA